MQRVFGTPELIVISHSDANLRFSFAGVAASPTVDTASLLNVLASEGATMRPLFPAPTSQMLAAPAAGQSLGLDLLGPEVYFRVQAPPTRLSAVCARLRSLPFVHAAYIKPPATVPVWQREVISEVRPDTPPTVTPNFITHQSYLDPAPVGMDAQYAWGIPGGKGENVSLIDLEWGWLFEHEDLTGKGGVVFGGNDSDTDHGTAVLGIVGGDDNAFGVTGFVPRASLSAASFGDSWQTSSATTIDLASRRLKAGDILILEIHRPGPYKDFQGDDTQVGFIATEWFPDDLLAIQRATSRGIIVVEAAGNGAQNFDDPLYSMRPSAFPSTWRNPFDPNNPGSGAVMVGAGAPPPGTHSRNWGPDRSRLDFSNHGRRLDTQGWGCEVTSCGYGDLQGGQDPTHRYTDTFAGTSSATPTVAGALACLQGILRAAGAPPLMPSEAVAALRSTGSPQQDAPGRAASQRIGNRPDLRALVAWAREHGH